MNILVVSNLYPPHVVGGYELGCADVVTALRARGHEVYVLASSYGLPSPAREGYVLRWLETEFGWDLAVPGAGLRLFQKEVRNRQAMRRALGEFQPDLVYVWSLHNLSVSPILIAQQQVPVCFYSSDEWLSHYEQRDRWLQTPFNPLRRVVKLALNQVANVLGGVTGPRVLDMRYVECTSAFIRDSLARAGKLVGQAEVIHWGIDLARFPFREAKRPTRTRLLYVGQVIEHKGVHTAIEAVEQLVRQGVDVTLNVVGRVMSEAYRQRLEQLAHGCEKRVHFTGPLPREHLAAIYADHDTLIFPSVWQEPFSITLLEAMASGLAIVGTATGGTPEILSHEHNALLFRTEDANACATEIARLIDDEMLYERLRFNGRETVRQSFQLKQMVDQIEQHLRQVRFAS